MTTGFEFWYSCRIEDSRLNVPLFKTIDNISSNSCIQACMIDEHCQFLNYNRGMTICELTRVWITSTVHLTSNKEYEFWEKICIHGLSKMFSRDFYFKGMTHFLMYRQRYLSICKEESFESFAHINCCMNLNVFLLRLRKHFHCPFVNIHQRRLNLIRSLTTSLYITYVIAYYIYNDVVNIILFANIS